MADKSMTVRLAAEQAAELETVAATDSMSVAEAVRQAISGHIDGRRKDKAFQARLRASLERNRQLLEKLTSR